MSYATRMNLKAHLSKANITIPIDTTTPDLIAMVEATKRTDQPARESARSKPRCRSLK